MDLLAVFTTVARREDADRIAQVMLDQGLAACVQLSTLHSHYVWQGKRCSEDEIRLLFKTGANRYAALEAAIRAHHPYELPAIYALPAQHAHAPYAEWVIAHSAGG